MSSSTLTVVVIFAMLLALANMALSGVSYGTLYGDGGLVKRHISETGPIGPTGPPGSGGGGATGPTGPPGGGTGSNSLAGLTDVRLANLIIGNSLVYTGTVWVNRTLATPMATLSILGDGITSTLTGTASPGWTNVMTATSTVLQSNNSDFPSNLWSVSNSSLVWGGSTQYFSITYDLTVSSSINTDILIIGLGINSTSAPSAGTRGYIDYGSANALTSFSATFVTPLSPASTITLLIQNNPTRLLTFERCAITAVGSKPL